MQYLYDGKKTDWVAPSAFYAMYHAVLALLYKLQYESRNQECAINAVEYFMESGIIDLEQEYIDMIRHAQEHDNQIDAKTIREEFDTEYSKDAFEIHADAIGKGEKCIICDDLLATGGTSMAAVWLVERLGGKVEGLFFLIELDFLNGRKKLDQYDVFSLIHFDAE